MEPDPALRDGLRTSGMISGRCVPELLPGGSDCPSKVSRPVVALFMSSGSPPGQEVLVVSTSSMSMWVGPASCLASSSGTAWAGGACAMVLAPDTKLLVRAEVEAAL